MGCPTKALPWVPGMMPSRNFATVAFKFPHLHQGPSAIDKLAMLPEMLPVGLALAQDIAAQLSLPRITQRTRMMVEALDDMRRLEKVFARDTITAAWQVDGNPLQIALARRQIIVVRLALLFQQATFLHPYDLSDQGRDSVSDVASLVKC